MEPGTTRTRAMRWSSPGWRSTLLGVAVSALVGAVFGPARRSLEWPAGLSARRAAAYVTANVILGFALREVQRRLRAALDEVTRDARMRVGREPTEREVHREWARRMLRRRLGREATEAEIEQALRPSAA